MRLFSNMFIRLFTANINSNKPFVSSLGLSVVKCLVYNTEF